MGRAEDQQPKEKAGRYGKGGQGGRERKEGQERRREPTTSPSTSPSSDREEEETDPEGRPPEPREPSSERRAGRGQRREQLLVEERKGKGKGGQGGGEQRSKVRSRSEGSPPQRLELWATGLPRRTTPKWLHDTFQGLSKFVLAPSRTGRPTARLVFQNQRSMQWALDRVQGRRPAQPHGEQPPFTAVRLEREAPPVKKVRVEEGSSAAR